MPTTNPRINVTLSPSLDLLVQRMATMTRTSKSQVLRELLEAAEPTIQRAVSLMEAASQAADAVKSELSRGMQSAMVDAERLMQQANDLLDTRSGDLVALAEEVRGRRPAGRAQRARTAGASGASVPGKVPQDPPPSYRGVRTSSVPSKPTRKTASKRGGAK